MILFYLKSFVCFYILRCDSVIFIVAFVFVLLYLLYINSEIKKKKNRCCHCEIVFIVIEV